MVIQNVLVLGSGVLGGQIAWHSAYHGKNVTVRDIEEEPLAKCKKAHERYAKIYSDEMNASAKDIEATKKRLMFTTDLEVATKNVDLVIEAVPEVLKIKESVYKDLAPLLPEHTILATNSSSLLPSSFVQHTGRPDKFCAMHFANLIWKLNLVEIMAQPQSSRETLAAATEYAIDIGQVPIPVRKEQSGYILNSWLDFMLNEALTLVTQGVGTPEDVDRTYLIANQGCKLGPFGIFDVIGIQTMANILENWGKEKNNEQMSENAKYLKTQYLDQGKTGLLDGEGFYKYPDPAFEADDFLAVPDKSAVEGIVDLVAPK